METVKLHNADVLDILPWMSDESVDCIITDPPYRTISGGSGPSDTHDRPVGVLSKNDGKVFEHNDIAFDRYMRDLYRVLTDPGHMWIFTNEMNRRAMEDAILDAGFEIHGLGAWIKNTCNPNRWGMKNGELYFLCRKGPARGFYTPGLKQFIHRDNVRGKLHPTEKPVGLMRDMVLASSRPDDIVFDPFMGVGSTGVAATHAGRRFIGVEIGPTYFHTAQMRLGMRAPG